MAIVTGDELRYAVTMYAIENVAGALIHESIAESQVGAWRKMRRHLGHRVASLRQLRTSGYKCVEVAFIRTRKCGGEDA